MNELFSVIEFENSVEIHPILDEKEQKKAASKNWEDALILAIKTVREKISNHEHLLNEWNDPKDIKIVEQLKDCHEHLENSSKEEYLCNVFWS